MRTHKHGETIYPATARCRKCKGSCCKLLPGIYHPKDIRGPKRDTIAKMLRERRAAVDCWEGDSPIFYLRPIAGDSMRVFDPSWGGSCQHLTPRGCALPRDRRPLGCLTIEVTTKDCEAHTDKYVCANWWAGYQDMLKELIHEPEECRAVAV